MTLGLAWDAFEPGCSAAARPRRRRDEAGQSQGCHPSRPVDAYYRIALPTVCQYEYFDNKAVPEWSELISPVHPRRSAARTIDDELTRNCTSILDLRNSRTRSARRVQKCFRGPKGGAPEEQSTRGAIDTGSKRHEEQATRGTSDKGAIPAGRQPTDGVQPWKSSTDVTQGFTPGVRINDGGTSPGPPTEPNGPTTVKVSSVETPGSSSMVAVPTSRP